MAPQPTGGEGTTKAGGGGRLSAGELAWIAASQWSGNNQITAVAIALAESGGDPKANNKSTDARGLWQINWSAWHDNLPMKTIAGNDGNQLYDPFKNAEAARFVYNLQGWKAWSVYTGGQYRGFIGAAREGVAHPKKPGAVKVGGSIEYQGSTENPIDQLFAPIIDFMKSAGLRVAGFVGGSLLIGGAVFLVAKKGVKV
jgi:hypothetical protein